MLVGSGAKLANNPPKMVVKLLWVIINYTIAITMKE
jgi:hypothetical protein